jgi:hypothetical protein
MKCTIANVEANSVIAALKANMKMIVECIVEEPKRLIFMQCPVMARFEGCSKW